MLAAALAVRAVRSGSVCVDLAEVRDEVGEDGAELAWPELDGWLAALAASPLLGAPHPLRLEQTRLYLDRYWREEEQVEQDLRRRAGRAAPPVADEAALRASLDRLFPGASYDEQRAAAETAVRQWTTVLTGGPGHRQDHHGGRAAGPARRAGVGGRRAPAADRAHRADRQGRGPAGGGGRTRRWRSGSRRPTPSGSATSGRSTLHRLLGTRFDSAVRFRHDRDNRLPHDVVVVDETSMVSLTMMARLLEALRPETRLVLVGDPDQLASIEAGAVLADLVEGLVSGGHAEVAALRTSHRFGSEIGELALAVREDRADDTLALLRGGGDAGGVRRGRRPARRAAVGAAARRPGDPGAPPRPATRPPRSRRWPGTGCSARTARARTASTTGTAPSSAGSPRRPRTRSGTPGTSAGRCW